MSAWTMETTDGFTQPELDTINSARAIMMKGVSDADIEKSINDALNNAWHEGMTAPALCRAAYDLLLGPHGRT